MGQIWFGEDHKKEMCWVSEDETEEEGRVYANTVIGALEKYFDIYGYNPEMS